MFCNVIIVQFLEMAVVVMNLRIQRNKNPMEFEELFRVFFVIV